MWKLALVIIAAFVVSRVAQTSTGDATCEREYPGLHEWVNTEVADGQPTRDRMVARLDRLLADGRSLGTGCLLSAALDRVVVLSVSARCRRG